VQILLRHWKKLTTGSTNRKIFSAAVTVGLMTALVKVAAVTRELVVAWRFGTGDALDAFLIAFMIPSFIINVVAGSFSVALIPTYIQVREQDGLAAAQRLFSGVTVWSLGVLGITTLLMVAAAPLYLPWIAGRFSPEKLDLTFRLLCTIAPVVLLRGIVFIWGALINAGERFALVAVSPVITPVISVLFILIGGRWGIFALAAGLVVGVALEMLVLAIALKRQGISLLPRWYGFDAAMRQVASQCVPMIAGAFLMSSATVVDQSMAAMLSPGSVTALNYGTRVIALPLELGATALGTAVIPYFSTMIAQENWLGIKHTIKRYLGLIFITTVPFTAVLILLSDLIIKILFQHGAFTAEDTQVVSRLQICFALHIPFYIAGMFLVRLISSMQANQFVMWVAGFSLIINIVLNYTFMKWIGVYGIALSTSFVYIFSFALVWFFVNKKIQEAIL
jgi:putative peptidoglycan lipid II flippase